MTLHTEITATEFGGAGDEQPGAYGGWIIPTEPGVALPMRFQGERPDVRVYANGRSVDCEIVDVGPWYPHRGRGPADPYWETEGQRPRAESDDRTNGAGIDLTPAAARAIGIRGKGVVDWEFIAEE